MDYQALVGGTSIKLDGINLLFCIEKSKRNTYTMTQFCLLRISIFLEMRLLSNGIMIL